MRKSEKIDLILSELSTLKSDVAKLVKQQSALMAELVGIKSRPAPKRPKPKPAKKASAQTKANKASRARNVPVLVDQESPAQPASRASSS
jgi:regulator of replication initiation timing